jgi:hypothetical protein
MLPSGFIPGCSGSPPLKKKIGMVVLAALAASAAGLLPSVELSFWNSRTGSAGSEIIETLCEPHHTRFSQMFIPPNWRFQMRKHISFTIAAAIMGLAMVFWIKDGVVKTNTDVVGSPLYSSSSMSILKPVY